MRSCLDYSLYIFDMGNVVIKDITVLQSISRQYGIPLDELTLDYGHYNFPLMEGTIEAHTYWRHVEHLFGVSIAGDPLAEFFHPTYNEPVVRIIKLLRANGRRIVCGSNTYASHWKYLEKEGFLTLFDALYASHEMGITKPSVRFFHSLLQQENVQAQDAFFIDDVEENIIAAYQLGITALHYADGITETADERLSAFFSALLQ